jgi:hypothetical protein
MWPSAPATAKFTESDVGNPILRLTHHPDLCMIVIVSWSMHYSLTPPCSNSLSMFSPSPLSWVRLALICLFFSSSGNCSTLHGCIYVHILPGLIALLPNTTVFHWFRLTETVVWDQLFGAVSRSFATAPSSRETFEGSYENHKISLDHIINQSNNG